MNWFKQLFSRRRLFNDLSEEIQAHLEEKIEELVASGMPRKEATAAARREFGNVTLVEERSREVWQWPSIESFLSDVRFATRTLLKNPGFTIVVVLTFAFSIAANAVNFSLADAMFLRPLPFVPQDRLLVQIHELHSGGYRAPVAPANFLDFQRQSHSFDSMEAYSFIEVNLSGDKAAERLEGARISYGLLRMLGGVPLLGREFVAEENQLPHAAMLSHALWLRRFGGDPRIVGQTIRLDGRPALVVGVMPKSFDFPTGAELWLPLTLDANQWNDRHKVRLSVVAMLKPSVSISEAQTELSGIAAHIEQAYPGRDKLIGARVEDIRNVINGNLTPMFISVMTGAVAFLLLIACVNVAGMQLSRAATRQREVALRTALGASRWRVARQLLTESILLSLLGGIAGLLLARWGILLTASSMPAETARQIAGWDHLRLDLRALAFTMLVATLAGIISGLVPAFGSSKPNLDSALKTGLASVSGHRDGQRLRSLLVATEIALALTLVIGAGLEVKGFRKMLVAVERSAPRSLLTLRVSLPESRYDNAQKRTAYFTQALQKLSALPGVAGAALFTTPPFSNNRTHWEPFATMGQATPPQGQVAVVQSISPVFFSLLKIPLRNGRGFMPSDSREALPVAIVSEKFARTYWPGKDPLGNHLRIGKPEAPGPWLTVIGIADDVEYDWTDNTPEPAIYIPYLQASPAESILAIRTSVDPLGSVPAIRRELASLDPDLPVVDVSTLERSTLAAVAGPLLLGGMMGALGLVALILAAVGVYGVMSFNVAQRTQEIGIRMSLGAERRDVLRLLIGRAAWITLLGVALGLAATLLMSPLLSSFFYGVSPTDPGTYIAVALFLLAVALLASYIPARRAMRVDPMVALRYE
jgi:putative ABC transport system permease protein